ncbi:hypothetical protein [Desulfatibacillum alkenivorans]|jgi:hypothetical protein|uniref:hypothetical protein n=1 Tax=Desulfatibacillum alkenivorans TaxID=259354 RepID=UPI0009357C3C|nr:hypothetical protein [Desulfatibacillum alkenivorans]
MDLNGIVRPPAVDNIDNQYGRRLLRLRAQANNGLAWASRQQAVRGKRRPTISDAASGALATHGNRITAKFDFLRLVLFKSFGVGLNAKRKPPILYNPVADSVADSLTFGQFRALKFVDVRP